MSFFGSVAHALRLICSLRAGRHAAFRQKNVWKIELLLRAHAKCLRSVAPDGVRSRDSQDILPIGNAGNADPSPLVVVGRRYNGCTGAVRRTCLGEELGVRTHGPTFWV